MGYKQSFRSTEFGSGLRSITKKLGIAGFAFFLVKGLLWLIIPGVIAAAL